MSPMFMTSTYKRGHHFFLYLRTFSMLLSFVLSMSWRPFGRTWLFPSVTKRFIFYVASVVSRSGVEVSFHLRWSQDSSAFQASTPPGFSEGCGSGSQSLPTLILQEQLMKQKPPIWISPSGTQSTDPPTTP